MVFTILRNHTGNINNPENIDRPDTKKYLLTIVFNNYRKIYL